VEKLLIEGGQPLSGTVVPAGNKNAALPLLAASLLTDEEVVLSNVPRIRDVEALVDLLVDLGAEVEWREEHTISLRVREIRSTDVDSRLAERIRASFLVAGPLLARCGGAFLPPPGGDVIGRRGSIRTSTPSARWAPPSSTTATSASPRPTAACRPATSSWTSRP
jgi:UDP-N-acetylglucosamine 1-carboxyvinyltransferase